MQLSPHTTEPVADKKALRARMLAWRGTVPEAERIQTATALAWEGIGFVRPVRPGAVVSGFASLPGELDCMPLLHRLAGDGVRLALPRVEGKGKPLSFRAWAPGDATQPGVWGIAEPGPDRAVLEPDILLVPLLAVDRAGWRLGYGGGFYDRSLAALRRLKPIIAIGLAYDAQVVDAVPHLDYDEPLDWVLTPSGALRCGG
ncbi:MAG: 5-formyltetrahydrofolate cyclo-ligase [Hyphomicrobiaceae bacterium]|nr:5-formyltetrahydrofolate cyclo-ligase [Hyphomicrobiaceae bacterium]